VNIAEQTIRIETSKNDDEPGECPLPQTAAVMRRRLVAGRGADELVSPFNADEWRYVWQQIKKSAGCAKMVFHDLRRSSACDKHAAGVDSSIIMSMQDWKSGEV
jgi:integrase